MAAEERTAGALRSLLCEAVSYALNQGPTLQTYLEDGRLDIENNATERDFRPFHGPQGVAVLPNPKGCAGQCRSLQHRVQRQDQQVSPARPRSDWALLAPLKCSGLMGRDTRRPPGSRMASKTALACGKGAM